MRDLVKYNKYTSPRSRIYIRVVFLRGTRLSKNNVTLFIETYISSLTYVQMGEVPWGFKLE